MSSRVKLTGLRMLSQIRDQNGPRHFLHTRVVGFLTLVFKKFGRCGSLGLIQEQNGDSVF